MIFPAIAILPPSDSAPLARAHAEPRQLRLRGVRVRQRGRIRRARLRARGQQPSPCLAPGPGTAEALAALGIAGARIPATTFDSDGLLALPELAAPRGKRIVIFRGEGGREQLGDTLRARGATVDYVDLLPARGAGERCAGTWPRRFAPVASMR